MSLPSKRYNAKRQTTEEKKEKENEDAKDTEEKADEEVNTERNEIHLS